MLGRVVAIAIPIYYKKIGKYIIISYSHNHSSSLPLSLRISSSLFFLVLP